MMTSVKIIPIAAVSVLLVIFYSGASDVPCYSYFCRCYKHLAKCIHNDNKLPFIPRVQWNFDIYEFVFTYNSLKHVGVEAFVNISNYTIDTLVLSHNNILTINSSAFASLQHLRILHLSDNPDVVFLAGALQNVPKSLQYIYLNGMGIRDADNLLNNLKNSEITGIHLARNDITTFNFSLLSGFHSLTTLTLQNNRLRKARSLIGSFSPTLQNLWLGGNNLSMIPFFCHRNMSLYPSFPALKQLGLANNTFGYNHHQMLNLNRFGYSHRQQLYPSQDPNHNRFSYQLGPETFDCLGNLYSLDISGNAITEIDGYTFANLTNLAHVILNSNIANLTIRKNAFSNERISNISLAYAGIVHIDEDAFFGCESIEYRDLSGNNFGKYTRNRIIELFHPFYKNLKHLFCQHCRLTSLPEIDKLTSLVVLKLDHNNIAEVQPNAFECSVNLRSLSLSWNRISTISGNVIPASKREELCYANLEQNPYQCDCELLWLKDWLIRDTKLFKDRLLNYVCASPPERKGHKIVDITDVYDDVCFHDGQKISFAFCAVGTALLMVLCFALGYKFRLNIRYCMLRKKNISAISEESQPLVQHDVYLLYCDDDFHWTRYEALPNLEQTFNLKTCFRQRDFHLKVHRVDNTVEHLRRSKSVVLILSNNFRRDSESEFELHLVQKRFKGRLRSLVIILLEEIEDRYLSHSLSCLLHKATLLRWPDANERGGFWEHVVASINLSSDIDIM